MLCVIIRTPAVRFHYQNIYIYISMATRQSRRLQGISPEWKLEILKTCFFCLSPVTPFSRSAVPLQCCRQFVHRHCQVEWEKTNRGTCGYCRQTLRRLFSLVEVSRWSLVADMQMLVSDDIITRDLQQVSHVFYQPFFFSAICSLSNCHASFSFRPAGDS